MGFNQTFFNSAMNGTCIMVETFSEMAMNIKKDLKKTCLQLGKNCKKLITINFSALLLLIFYICCAPFLLKP